MNRARSGSLPEQPTVDERSDSMTKAAVQHKTISNAAAPTSQQGGAPTVGQQLHHAPGVRAAIGILLSELRAKSETITDIRPARPDLKQSYDELIARATATRGRGLLYPYIGSGIGNGALVEL